MAYSHDTNLVAAYLDGSLSERERARMEAHLADCVECRGILAIYARAVSSGETADAPAPVRAGGSLQRWRNVRTWLPAAAALALMAAGGVAILMYRTPQASNTISESAPRPSPGPAPPPAEPRTPSREVSPGDATQSAPASPQVGELAERRSGERQVGEKTFRLVAGEWIDTEYDQFAMLPVVAASTAQEREALLSQVPALRRYAALGRRVTVVYEGTVYRFAG